MQTRRLHERRSRVFFFPIFVINAGSHTSAAMSETEALALLRSMADKNQVLKSLIGQGYHETHTPYVILRNMLENPVRGSASVKRHRRASSPGMMDVGRFLFDFE